MKAKELQEAVHAKNEIIVKQTRRITMLEEKFSGLRARYLRLKQEMEKAEVHHAEVL